MSLAILIEGILALLLLFTLVVLVETRHLEAEINRELRETVVDGRRVIKSRPFAKPPMPLRLLGVTRNKSGGWGILDSEGAITGNYASPRDAHKVLERNGGPDA